MGGERSVRSVSVEQEDLQSTENVAFFNVVESGEEQSCHPTEECQRDISGVIS